MRILYNSKDEKFKSPFGTLTEGQSCRISIFIPVSCKTERVSLIFLRDNGERYTDISMPYSDTEGDYEIYSCEFSLESKGLYFYYFRIKTKNEEFSLYREGKDMTNMEEGELWQLSCISADFSVPQVFSGKVMYQIFPDRFNRVGECDTSGKLGAFWLHKDMRELPCYLPDERGEVKNCDFYGGNLRGIAEKLEYLLELGVGVIYLNPIFKAYSNHRYDTADYKRIDELLGGEEDFICLCDEAHKRGMKIILDGVFSHTGSNSIYFDKLGIFGGGACSDENSPYKEWYDFSVYPSCYTSWWGIESLPCVNEMSEGFLDFIIDGEDSVVAHWLSAGADGIRLDVADELPDEFIARLRKRLKEIKPEALLLGEVWEDASNKISYGKRRKYFVDGELDSVMNYPLRNAILDYARGNDNGRSLSECVMTIAENYPREVVNTLMNMLSTHDTERVLSALSPISPPYERAERATYKMSEEAREEALARVRLAGFLQFTLPGMPCIYYGDEIGMEGLEDPFCRCYFDWDLASENALREFFVALAEIRNSRDTLRLGEIKMNCDSDGLIFLERRLGNTLLRGYANNSGDKNIRQSGKVLISEGAKISDGEVTLKKYGFLLEEVGEE